MSRYRELIERWLRGEADPAPIVTLLNLRLLSYSEGLAEVALEAGPRYHNPMGVVHGGILCDLADAAMGTAFATTLKEGEDFTTLHFEIRYLRPVREGLLVASARAVHRGRTIGSAECEILDVEGRPVARASVGCLVKELDTAHPKGGD
jgi:uncharacterized protein (TIGR00369 family)